MADQHEVDLDSIIDRLLEVRGSRPGKQVQLLEAEIRFLCTKAREIFISQPILLELEAPIKVRQSQSPRCASPPDSRDLSPVLVLWLNAPLFADLRRYPRPILRPAPSL